MTETCGGVVYAGQPLAGVEVRVARWGELLIRGPTLMRGYRLDEEAFAFPEERKEPLTDALHVRNAIARFDQVEGVSDAERDQAWRRIVAAAKRFDVSISADDWRELFKDGAGTRK